MSVDPAGNPLPRIVKPLPNPCPGIHPDTVAAPEVESSLKVISFLNGAYPTAQSEKRLVSCPAVG
jgi:hypothetical protein